jgi:hypothetical protein
MNKRFHRRIHHIHMGVSLYESRFKAHLIDFLPEVIQLIAIPTSVLIVGSVEEPLRQLNMSSPVARSG